MKTKTLALGFALGLGVCFWIFHYHRKMQGLTPLPQIRGAKSESSASSFRSLVRQARPELSEEEIEDIDPACREPWRELRALSFEEPMNVLPRLGACAQTDESLREAQQDYAKNCGVALGLPLNAISEECESSLVLLRARLSEYLNRDHEVSEISDLSVLSDLLIAAYDDEDGDVTREVAERMMQLDPKFTEAAKAVAAVNALEIASLSQEPAELAQKGPEYWEQVARDLRRQYDLNPNDPENKNLYVVSTTRGLDPKLLTPLAEKMIKENPESSDGYFYLATSEWAKGNVEAAKRYFQKAYAMDPQNSQYAETAQRLRQASDEPFQFEIGFQHYR